MYNSHMYKQLCLHKVSELWVYLFIYLLFVHEFLVVAIPPNSPCDCLGLADFWYSERDKLLSQCAERQWGKGEVSRAWKIIECCSGKEVEKKRKWKLKPCFVGESAWVQ